MKIKITEYMAGAVPPELYALSNQQSPLDTLNANSFFPQPQSALASPSQVSPWSMPTVGPAVSLNQSPSGGKYYTIQRVNGNGGNGKSDGVAGPHKHTLEDSDRVKKNSVIRWMVKNEKDKKKTQVSLEGFLNSNKFYRISWYIYLDPGKASSLSCHSRCGEPREMTEICGAPCIFLFGGSVTVKKRYKSSLLPPQMLSTSQALFLRSARISRCSKPLVLPSPLQAVSGVKPLTSKRLSVLFIFFI